MGFGDAPKGTVFRSGGGRTCPRCGHPADGCRCAKEPAAAAGPVRVARETKGRKGKGVTVVRGLGLNADELKALAKRLKQACGSGGTVKDGTIEIQGDHRDRVVEALAGWGYPAKRAGG